MICSEFWREAERLRVTIRFPHLVYQPYQDDTAYDGADRSPIDIIIVLMAVVVAAAICPIVMAAIAVEAATVGQDALPGK